MLDNEHKSSVVVRVPAVRIRAGQPYQALVNMQRPFAGFFSARSVRSAVSRRVGRHVGLLGGTWAVLLGPTGCEDEYAQAPTFCDDWCAALRHPSDCASGPASCVRDCELTKASEDCFPLQEQLLGCYQELEPEAFSCAPRGSQSAWSDRLRVEKTACRTERDTLFACEAPGFGECLDLCRGYQQILTEGAIGKGDVIAASDECLLLTQPCETVCWTAFAFTSDDLESLRLPTGGGEGSTDVPGPAIPTLDGGTDAGIANPTDPLTALFAPCFELSGIGETMQ